jgi:hypothetical protein
MLVNALATSDSRFYRGDRGVVRALSRDRHLVCAYRIIINKRITLTSSVSKRQSFADDATSTDIVVDSPRDLRRFWRRLLERGHQHAFIRLSDFGRSLTVDDYRSEGRAT